MRSFWKLLPSLFLRCLLFVAPLSTFGWWDTPHMIIMEICRNQLDETTIQQTSRIIEYLKDDFPESSCFLTAACFPDDLTPNGLAGFKVWHGVLTPYSPDGFLSEQSENCILSLIKENNLHSAISQSLSILRKPNSPKWQQSFLLRFLLHSVGDIHHPLHCIQLYSSKFPSGDLAGHRFKLNESYFKNLHHLWDSGFGLGAKRLNRPLSDQDRQQIETIAYEVMSLFPPESLPINQMDYHIWSQESYQLAINFAYKGLPDDGVLPPSYMDEGKRVVMRQMALAGYRLANLLTELFHD
jgi:hypothetical protein